VSRDEAACGQARQQDAATLLAVVLQQVSLFAATRSCIDTAQHVTASLQTWDRRFVD